MTEQEIARLRGDLMSLINTIEADAVPYDAVVSANEKPLGARKLRA